MRFPAPLVHGHLIRRYKRFLADVRLDDGQEVTAHLANSGSMLGTSTPGMEVWLAPAGGPGRKLDWRWELVVADGALVGVNTSHPNTLAAEAIAAGTIPELRGYDRIRREVNYGQQRSRIDLLLESDSRPPCYVEIKNVHLRRCDTDGVAWAEFPDAKTVRGAKHLEELRHMHESGNRAVLLFLVQRQDVQHFRAAADIDPVYATLLRTVAKAGVEVLCYTCRMSTDAITVDTPLPITLETDR